MRKNGSRNTKRYLLSSVEQDSRGRAGVHSRYAHALLEVCRNMHKISRAWGQQIRIWISLLECLPPCRHSRIAPSHRSSPQAISHSFPTVHPLVTPASLLPTGALPACYFPRVPSRPLSRRFHIAPSHRSSPQAISQGSPPSTISSLLLPPRSSPQAISHGFSSVHPIVASVSFLPHGALPKLFPTASPPSTLSSLPNRSFPTELPPSYFPRFRYRPPSHHSRIAPSHRNFLPMLFPTVSPLSTLSKSRSFPTEPPQAISHGFHSVHRIVASVSLLPNGALPKLFPTVAPSPRSSPQAISHGFPSVHPVVIPVSLLPTAELSPSYFPRLPSCRHSRIAPSHQPTGALPKLFPTGSLPSTLSSLPYRSFSPELSPSYFPGFPPRPPSRHCSFPHGALPKLFPTVSPPCTLLSLPSRSFPTELSPSYFPRLPLHPHYRRFQIAPSQRSSPQAISHGFATVRPLITPASLLPTGTFSPCYFPRFPLCPPSRNPAPSPRSLPKLFPTVSIPCTVSSLPYRSFPTELSPSYFPRSLLPHGALPKLFPTVSLPSTLSSFPYRSFPPRSSPQAISHGFPPLVTPVSLLPTSPPELSPSYFPRLPFRPPCLFPMVSSPSTQSLLPSVPSQRSSPQAISHGFSSVLLLVKSVSLCSHLSWKTRCFALRLPPQHKSHATFL